MENIIKKPKIVLVRHAQSTINRDASLAKNKTKEDCIEINTNSTLTENGTKEAFEVADKLYNFYNNQIIKIYVSKFLRSHLTGMIIASKFEKCEIIADKRINEINLFEYNETSDILKKILRDLRTGFINHDKDQIIFESGTLLKEKYLEMLSFLNEIEGDAVVVSHTLALSSLFVNTGIENEKKLKIANCDTFIYEKEKVKRLV